MGQVSIVAGGTVASQAIAVAFSPILTRLYGPDAFGVLGIFVAMVAFLVPGVTLAHHVAVVLPQRDREGRLLVDLAVLVALGGSLLLLCVVLLLRDDVASVFKFTSASAYLNLVPVAVLFAGFEQTYRQWLIRKQQFHAISGISVAQSAASNAAMAGCGLVAASGPVLLVINTAGHALYAALLWLSARNTLRGARVSAGGVGTHPRKNEMMRIAHVYRDFPLYRAPQVLLNSASQSMVPLLLAAFFGPVPAGFYTLSRRVLGLPSTLVSQSVGTVLLPRLAETAQSGERLQPLLLKATAGLAVVGLLPFGMVALLGPMLFAFVFGPEWGVAGEYSRWLALWLYFNFAGAPCIQALPILGLQREFLVYEVVAACSRCAGFVFGATIFDSSLTAIALFSIAGAVLYVVLIGWVLLRSGGAPRESLRQSVPASGEPCRDD